MKKVNAETEHAIIRHHLVDDWPIGTIASQLGVHHGVVRRVLRDHGRPSDPPSLRKRRIDPYVHFITQTFEKYPKLHASRLYQMVVQRGYEGSQSHFRRLAAELRPYQAAEPFMRLTALPGEEVQVDWAHFGKQVIGRATRPLAAFVMTLSWSRMIWLQYFYDMKMTNFIRGHIDGFTFFQGTPRKALYDNLRSAVTCRVGQAVEFNEKLLELASHYGFEPRAAAPARGNEKGRVERAIRYIRANFFAAREFRDIADLNEQAIQWSLEVSAARKWPDDDRTTVGKQFEVEKTKLLGLPPTPFETCIRLPAKVGRTPWVRFDTNDYSLPPAYVRTEVTVLADHQSVRVVVDGKVVALHARSYDRRVTVSAAEHVEDLAAVKRRGARGSATHRLVRAAPAAALLLERAAERGQNLGSLVSQLLPLLDMHGATALQSAFDQVNIEGRVSSRCVRLVLERDARDHGRSPAMPVNIERSELLDITVPQPDMSTYDRLMEDNDEENS